MRRLSFETPAARAPQDEAEGNRPLSEGYLDGKRAPAYQTRYPVVI